MTGALIKERRWNLVGGEHMGEHSREQKEHVYTKERNGIVMPR